MHIGARPTRAYQQPPRYDIRMQCEGRQIWLPLTREVAAHGALFAIAAARGVQQVEHIIIKNTGRHP
eukprot:SAG31_NODE_41431_length_276_cov_0.587571_1_plen_66_part_01